MRRTFAVVFVLAAAVSLAAQQDLSKVEITATKVAGILSGVVGSLPAGETAPAGADILVIVGKQ